MMTALRRLWHRFSDGRIASVGEEAQAAEREHADAARQVRVASRLSRMKSREARLHLENVVADGQAERVARATAQAFQIARQGRGK